MMLELYGLSANTSLLLNPHQSQLKSAETTAGHVAAPTL